MTQFVAVAGNPIAGFCFFGPFSSSEAAVAWGEQNLKNEPWWVAPVEEAC